jgi:hypothetical protein
MNKTYAFLKVVSVLSSTEFGIYDDDGEDDDDQDYDAGVCEQKII